MKREPLSYKRANTSDSTDHPYLVKFMHNPSVLREPRLWNTTIAQILNASLICGALALGPVSAHISLRLTVRNRVSLGFPMGSFFPTLMTTDEDLTWLLLLWLLSSRCPSIVTTLLSTLAPVSVPRCFFMTYVTYEEILANAFLQDDTGLTAESSSST
ncbi:hypothetical protein SNK03_012725 [Fusarium graminearum]